MRSNSPYPVLSVRSHSPFPRAHSPFPRSHSPFYPRPHSRSGVPAPKRSLSCPPGVNPLFLDDDFGSLAGDGEKGDEEKAALLGAESAFTTTYTRRWYLLVLFSLVALLQTLQWATWGPISQSAEVALGWNDANIAMTVLLGNVPFCLLCIPASWLMDNKGFRLSVLLTSLAVAVGAALRCLLEVVPSSYVTWCMYGGQLINGIAGPVAQGGGALFSNLWFPQSQRATSTAISTFIGYLGSALAFILGPLIVPSPPLESDPNVTIPEIGNVSFGLHLSSRDNNTVLPDYTPQWDGIANYLYYQAIAAGVVFVLVLVYFPDRPPKPPSLSASIEREDFKSGLLMLIRNKQYWLIAGAFCLSMGVFEVWDAVLDVNLAYIGISQTQAGLMGFWCVLAGCITGLAICRLADIFFRQIRVFLLVSYVVTAVFILWFILIYIAVLPFDLVSIYFAVILSGVFLDGCSPLVYELACEAAYPAGEGVASCFMQMLFVAAGIAFTAVQSAVPDIGTTWMNWTLFGSICAAIPLLCCVGDVFGRASLDDVEDQVVIVKEPSNPSMQWGGVSSRDLDFKGQDGGGFQSPDVKRQNGGGFQSPVVKRQNGDGMHYNRSNSEDSQPLYSRYGAASPATLPGLPPTPDPRPLTPHLNGFTPSASPVPSSTYPPLSPSPSITKFPSLIPSPITTAVPGPTKNTQRSPDVVDGNGVENFPPERRSRKRKDNRDFKRKDSFDELVERLYGPEDPTSPLLPTPSASPRLARHSADIFRHRDVDDGGGARTSESGRRSVDISLLSL